MQPTTQQRLTNLIRGGVAVSLATTLMVPTTALAEVSSAAKAQQATTSQASEPSSSDAGASESASSADAGNGSADADASDDTSGSAGSEKVTIIVQLEDEGNEGVSLLSSLMGTEDQDRHAYFKQQVRELAADGASGDGGSDDASLSSVESSAGKLFSSVLGAAGATGSDAESGAGDATVEEIHDYYNVIDGFAVKAPAYTLESIKQLSGVKNAFIEQSYSVPADQADEGAALKNQASLDITQADQIEQKGDGEVIAIIDTGLDTDHEAFSGDLNDDTVALSEEGAANARKSMTGGGAGGSYISEKIPFAYDYADGDSDVNPGISGLEHGTHVAGIASANGGDQIRGTAPNAQIAIMKVASDSTGSLYDSAIIAALDDVLAIGASSVNMSVGADAGFSGDGESTYNDMIGKLESKGVTVNVAAGNSYSSANKNQSGSNLPYATDPDSGIASTPATVSGSFAVASMNTDKVEVEDTATYLTAADGTKMRYWEASDPDGQVRSHKFADLADGSYDVVWGDIGRVPSMCGDVSGEDNCLAGKVVLVRGHGDFYGSEQSYARVCATMSNLGAAAVVFYDPSLSEDDLANVRLGGGADDTDSNWGSTWYDANSCPAIFVTEEAAEKLKAISADARAITKSTPTAAMSAFLTADGSKVAYQQLNGTGTLSVPRFSDLADGDYQYVWGGIGRNDYEYDEDGDTSEVDVSGKIVLMEGHGVWPITEMTISYDRAISFYQEKGAKAIIFYNAEIGDDLTQKQQLDDDGWLSSSASIPCAVISQTDALALKEVSRAAATKTGTITIKAGTETGGEVATKSMYAMSSYSSWGVTPDLKLKPEIAAPGGNVYSSVLNNQYAYYSGTSMATPQISGISALVHQYVNSNEKFANLTSQAKARAVTQLLMSTASPMANPADESSYYSPRQQGAGIANAVAATSSDVLAEVDGAEDASRPKADLGESTSGAWTFTITLHNYGSQERTFAPDTAALSEKVANGLFQQQSENWTGKGISVSYAGSAYDSATGTVKIAAGGLANLTVSITCEDAFKQFAAENAPSGTFVDGFSMLKSTDGGVDLSVPFMGFYGDWSAASAFDGDADESYHMFGSTFVDNWSRDLGVNPMATSDSEKVSDLSKVVVSNSGFSDAPHIAYTRTGLLRNVDNLTISMTGPDGEDEGSASYDFARKSFYNQNVSRIVCAEDYISGQAFFAPYAYDDAEEGAYTMTKTATTAGPTPEQQTRSYTLYYDKTAPELTSIVYDDNDGDPTLTYTVKDNYFAASIDLVSPNENGITPYKRFFRVLLDDSNLTGQDADGKNVYQVTVKVSDVKAAWAEKYGDAEMPNTVCAYAWDYGMLVSDSATSVVTPVAATAVTLSAESLAIAPSQQAQLSATLTPADTTETQLTWSSSNASVASVDETGKVTGIAEGTTTITVAVAGRPEISAETTVKVAAVSADQGLVLSSDNVRCIKDGDAVELNALLASGLEGQKVEWASSDTEVFSVSAVEGSSTKAKLSGGYQVGDAVLTATVTTADGSTKTATATVSNRTADYDDFVIDENHVLRGYTGSKTTIYIPNDVTEIGEGAFRGDSQLERIAVPASVRKIDREAFACITSSSATGWSKEGSAKQFSFEDTEAHPSQLTEIAERAFVDGGVSGYLTLPGSLTTLGTQAFASCLGMSGVTIPDSVRTIPDNCFEQTAIEVVTMSDNVESIGTRAFANNLFLTQIKLTNTAEGAATNGLPSHLRELSDGAFSSSYLGAEGTSVITVPGTVKNLGQGVFSGDRFLTDVVLEDGVESIGYGCFAGTSITKFVMPDSVTHVEDQLFQDTEGLKEVVISRNLAADDLAGTFSWCFSLSKVTVPDDALNYASVDGVVYSKDLSTLVYCPTAKTGTLSIPEGVSRIAYDAFESSKLSDVRFPSTLATIETNGFAKQLDVVDLGSSIVEVQADAFRQHFYADEGNNAGYTPAHLIVRGGAGGTAADGTTTAGGSYADTKRASQQQTAYFGEGMTSLDFSRSGAPGTLVVPASLASLDLSGNASNPKAITVYAPAGSAGSSVAAAALEAIGADVDTQLVAYTPLTVNAMLSGIPVAGQTVGVSAEASGGVDGAKQFRFVQTNIDGTETVLRDWSAATSIDWTVPTDGTTLRCEVRDATMISASASFGPQAAVITGDVSTTPATVIAGQETEALCVSVSAEEDAAVSYQWYKDGEAIEGATGASYTPASDVAGTSEYTCLISTAKDGLVAVTKSSTATVKVVAAASSPAITADLPAMTRVSTRSSVQLSVGAEAADEDAVLTYQWFCDGAAIAGAVGSSITVSSDAACEHTYYVEVTSTVGLASNKATARSASARIVVTDVLFSDVSDPSAWYFTGINAAARLGYMTGYAGTDLFGPDDTLTRGQAACVLANMANCGGRNTPWSGEFSDVGAGDYFAGAVAWAKASGVAGGYSGTDLFGPWDNLTREQMAQLLYNYAKSIDGADVSVADPDAELARFGDADGVSGWAREAVAWALSRHIMGNGGFINAQGEITRAEAAKMAVNFQPEAKPAH